jgi:hypothetical protein
MTLLLNTDLTVKADKEQLGITKRIRVMIMTTAAPIQATRWISTLVTSTPKSFKLVNNGRMRRILKKVMKRRNTIF